LPWIFAAEDYSWLSVYTDRRKKTAEGTAAMTDGKTFSLEGSCDCGSVRYRMNTAPMIVHCCHCRWCQRETGSAFALNAVVEAAQVEILQGAPEIVQTPSESGRGQKIARCPTCRVALWSHYALAGDAIRFVRVGTLDDPDRVPPDIHIYTESKQPWVVLPEGARAVPQFYNPKEVWTPESQARWRTAQGKG
jgi:hypothetical protein